MLVSNWAQNYWAVSTVAKKTLYNYKNVYGGVVEPFIGSKDLDEVSLMDIQKLVLATTPHQARLALLIIKTLYREAKPSRLPRSIQMYWLKGDYSAKGVKISKSEKTIIVPLEESVNKVLEKTTVALSYCIAYFDFDQVLRTNTSCYFSPTLIQAQLSQLPQVGL
jgi:hypothetical protein